MPQNKTKLIPCKLWITKQSNQTIIDRAGLFAGVMSDPTKVKIVLLLDQYNRHDEDKYEELYVTDLSEHIGVSVSAISHSLRTMESWGFVTKERKGQSTRYTLSDLGQKLLDCCEAIPNNI